MALPEQLQKKMLREKGFFAAYKDGYQPEPLTMTQKVDRLFERFEAGVESLMRNRKVRLERQRARFLAFDSQLFVVDQSSLKFVH